MGSHIAQALRNDKVRAMRSGLACPAALLADHANAAVEVEVIAVRVVVVRTQRHPEIAARARVGGAQEAGLGRIASPPALHADDASVAERKAADVDGIGAGMLAAPVHPQP